MRATLTARTGHETATLKFAATMVATPLIGLAYVVLAPFAGLALVAGLAIKGLVRHAATLRDVALFFAAPFIGLAYIVFLPVVGLAALAWTAGRALAAHGGALTALATPVRALAHRLARTDDAAAAPKTLEVPHLGTARHAAA